MYKKYLILSLLLSSLSFACTDSQNQRFKRASQQKHQGQTKATGNSQDQVESPHLAQQDLLLFQRYVSQASSMLELGAGKSTPYILATNPSTSLVSVETDKKWIKWASDKCQNLGGQERLTFVHADVGETRNWGNPSKLSSKWINYTASLVDLKKQGYEFDTIMVDGRFRAASALLCAELWPQATILFDDFLDRPHYHGVLTHFDFLEKGKRMAVLRVKKDVKTPAWMEALPLLLNQG